MQLIQFLKEHTVLVVAFLAALLSSVFVPISKEYISYIDFRTLTCLFCTLLVVGAFKNICLFEILARKLVEKITYRRTLILTVVFITFFGSMVLANDMALLTFLPLGYFVLKNSDNENYMIFTFIMQNIAANLGGMLTPFGNPQNIYLFSHYMIDSNEFTRIMLLPFCVATCMIILCCMCIKNEKVQMIEASNYTLPKNKAILYTILFVISVMVVFRIFPYVWGLIFISAAIFVLDKKAFLNVDYPLLLTFTCFFIFAGNVARIDAVNLFLSNLVKWNPLIVGVLSCQVISNVPSAILLSHFTSNYQQLLVAVNIGGCGTLIASLASLITFSSFTKFQKENTKKYLIEFSLFNFSFLVVLLLVELAVFYL